MAWAGLCLCGSLAASVNCVLQQQLPPHYPVPSPPGKPLGFHCSSVSTAVSQGDTNALAFDPSLGSWRRSGDAFGEGQPLTQGSVAAVDVDARWEGEQRSLLSEKAKGRSNALVPIGGDYWQATPFPVVPAAYPTWVSSGFKMVAGRALPARAKNEAAGWIARDFEVNRRYLRFYLGGDAVPGVGVEVLVKGPLEANSCSKQLTDAATELNNVAKDGQRLSPPDGSYVSLYLRHPVRRDVGGESSRDDTVPIELDLQADGCVLSNRHAMVRIFDLSQNAHVNVGHIELTNVALSQDETVANTPVWGLADYHTHPTNYLALGGLQGIHTVWGSPGGSMKNYVGDPMTVRNNLSHDVPPCDEMKDVNGNNFNGHHGGMAAPTMIDVGEGRVGATLEDLAIPAMADTHPSQGGPTFKDFPDFRRGAHEQYHISQIHRAYLGGLRLLSAMAVHNKGLEYGMGWTLCGEDGKPTVDTTDDLTMVRAHVRAMRQLAELNSEWMQIAYTPEEARRIIRANKLAVVLGVEVAQLGANADVKQEVDELYELGVRQVVPVHAMDNMLGGPAVFVDLYNTVNDFLNRPSRYRDRVETLSGALDCRVFDASFFSITTRPSPPTDTPNAEPTEAIEFRLSDPPRVVLSDVFPHPGPFTYPFGNDTFGVLHPLVNTTPFFEAPRGVYDGFPPGGHRNTRGLSGRGVEYIGHLMQHGMLVDLAHMSDETLSGVYDATNKACPSYPLMASHAHFRPLPLQVDYSDRAPDFVSATNTAVRADFNANKFPMDACIRDNATCDPGVLKAARAVIQQGPQRGFGTVNRSNLPREYDLPSSEIQQVRNRNGVVGVFLGQGPLETAAFSQAGNLPGDLTGLPFQNDCASSSKGFAAALLFAQARMKGSGAVGVASDFTLISNTVPRFGDNACAAYLGAGAGSGAGAQLLDTLFYPSQYAFSSQRDAVRYSGGVKSCVEAGDSKLGERCATNALLDPYQMGDRTYDFNYDGLAQYGLVPDMLQDTANVLHAQESLAFEPLFRSANGYIEMWEAAWRLARCGQPDALCQTPPPRPPDPLCTQQSTWERAECGDACPCAWNGGSPLTEIAEVDGECALGKPIRFPGLTKDGKRTFVQPKYTQHRADPLVSADDLTRQGDWGVFPVRSQQTWICGGGPTTLLNCPSSANYVKVRRVLDTTVSRVIERCDFQPLPPETGNRRVVFQCLVGPPDTGARWAAAP
jgi:microsomal dipeptidase-like Zn-dependent dipeptidase